MRYLIKFSYDGTCFCGFQKQDGLRSVQEELEKAISYINGQKSTKITGSGRTDRGVHALNQTAHFDIDVNITLYKLKCALNSLLPEDIHVNSVEKKDDEFHARYMAKSKTYKYLLNVGEYNPIKRHYIHQYNKSLDIEKMNRAIKDLVGEHDFESFVSQEAELPNYTRTIYDAYIKLNGDIVEFYFTGTGFMKYQVRNMVGTLIKIGSGKLEENIIKEILNDASKRKYVYTAKAEGLYLVEVKY